jgi:hypothetical protein
MSVCLSVRMEQLGSHSTDFYEIWYLSIFQKCVEKIPVLLESVMNNGYFPWKPMNIYDNISPSFFLEWEILRIKVVEKITTHILCSITLFWKSCRLWDNVEKCGTGTQVTDDNILLWREQAICVSFNERKDRHTLITFNSYCFSTTTIVTQTRLSVTLYVHSMACWHYEC